MVDRCQTTLVNLEKEFKSQIYVLLKMRFLVNYLSFDKEMFLNDEINKSI